MKTMDMKKIKEFPYILDEWAKVVEENPEWKFVYDGVSINGRRRIEVEGESTRLYAYLKKKV